MSVNIQLPLAAISVILALGFGCTASDGINSPSDRMTLFINQDMPESNLVPFLVDGGIEMVPILLREIESKDLPKRRYAIAALGELGGQQALKSLIAIVHDQDEQDYFRCDALESAKEIVIKIKDDSSLASGNNFRDLEIKCDVY